VSVIEKGTNNGVFTDNDGSFTINYKDENSIIAFNFVGLIGQEITVGKQREVNITLNSNNVLGMVEVVGSRRQDRTAVESVVPVDIIEVSRFLNTLVSQMLTRCFNMLRHLLIRTNNPELMVPIILILLPYAVLALIKPLYL
jgi:hypothetical protein